jgi:hypothetical protein
MRRRHFILSVMLILLLAQAMTAAAQESELVLRISRTWGYGGPNGDIQGTFTFKADGPEDLTAVAFYIDDALVGRVEHPPCKLRFRTAHYPLGEHQLYAMGRTADGRTLKSNVLVRNFVPARTAWAFVLKIGAPLLFLTFAIPAFIYWLDKKRNPGKYSGYGGPQGGAICPHCGCPFPRHWWGLNFGGRKYDRCPHCHKWSMVGRASESALRAAAIACGLASPPQEQAGAGAKDEKEDLRKRLDESRYFPED